MSVTPPEPGENTVDGVAVRKWQYGLSAYATKQFSKGDRIGVFEGKKVDQSTQHSVTRTDGTFIHPTGDLGFLNHRCTPNTELRDEGDKIVLYARRDIDVSDDMNIDYEKTEKVISAPFDCDCGPACRGRIIGSEQRKKQQRENIR